MGNIITSFLFAPEQQQEDHIPTTTVRPRRQRQQNKGHQGQLQRVIDQTTTVRPRSQYRHNTGQRAQQHGQNHTVTVRPKSQNQQNKGQRAQRNVYTPGTDTILKKRSIPPYYLPARELSNAELEILFLNLPHFRDRNIKYDARPVNPTKQEKQHKEKRQNGRK